MRGKLKYSIGATGKPRIIPAHAGQTAEHVRRGHYAADHPRACGANGVAVADSEFVGGSSPRMRGKPLSVAPRRMPGRIIPAHAGQTNCLRYR